MRHVINRLPTPILNSKSPFKIFLFFFIENLLLYLIKKFWFRMFSSSSIV